MQHQPLREMALLAAKTWGAASLGLDDHHRAIDARSTLRTHFFTADLLPHRGTAAVLAVVLVFFVLFRLVTVTHHDLVTPVSTVYWDIVLNLCKLPCMFLTLYQLPIMDNEIFV